jgi:hypothetical protein
LKALCLRKALIAQPVTAQNIRRWTIQNWQKCRHLKPARDATKTGWNSLEGKHHPYGLVKLNAHVGSSARVVGEVYVVFKLSQGRREI